MYQAANIKKPHDIRTSKLCKQLLTDNYVASESKFLSIFFYFQFWMKSKTLAYFTLVGFWFGTQCAYNVWSLFWELGKMGADQRQASPLK